MAKVVRLVGRITSRKVVEWDGSFIVLRSYPFYWVFWEEEKTKGLLVAEGYYKYLRAYLPLARFSLNSELPVGIQNLPNVLLKVLPSTGVNGVRAVMRVPKASIVTIPPTYKYTFIHQAIPAHAALLRGLEGELPRDAWFTIVDENLEVDVGEGSNTA